MIAMLQLRAESHSRIDDAQATRWLHRELSLEAVENAVLTGSRDEPIALLDDWSGQLPAGRMSWVTLAARVIAAFGEDDRDLVETLVRQATQLELEPDHLVLLAESVLRATTDGVRASELIAGVEQPALARDLHERRSEFEAVESRYRLARVLRATGQEIDADETVPMTTDSRDEGLVRFERAVMRTAIIEGAAWAGETFGSAQQDDVVRVIRLYYVSRRSGRDWSQWYFAIQERPELFRRLVDAVAAYGDDAVEWLQRRVHFEFAGSPEYWPAAARRPLLLALDRLGLNKDWVNQELEHVAELMLGGEDVSGRLDQAVDQAEAWLRVGETARANEELMHAVHLTLGVGYEKDDQVESWIEWLRHVNTVEPNDALTRTEWFTRAILAMRDGGAGREGEAARTLVDVTFDWSAPGALALTDWFVAESATPTTCGEVLRALRFGAVATR